MNRVHNGLETLHDQEVKSGAADQVDHVINKKTINVKRGRTIDNAQSLIDLLF